MAKTASTAGTETKKHTPWEYAQVQGTQVQSMNKMGEDGWELVKVENGWCTYKREKLS